MSHSSRGILKRAAQVLCHTHPTAPGYINEHFLYSPFPICQKLGIKFSPVDLFSPFSRGRLPPRSERGLREDGSAAARGAGVADHGEGHDARRMDRSVDRWRRVFFARFASSAR